MNLVDQFGLVADIWDTSYEGFLEFSKTLNRNNSSLKKDFENSLIVILNNDRPFKPIPEKFVQADAMFPKKELLQAALDSGLKFYFVGKTKNHYNDTLSFFLLPSTGLNSIIEAKSIDQFITELKSKDYQTIQTGLIGKIHLQETWIFRSPTDEHMIERAQKLQTKLKAEFPNQRFYVLYRFDGSKISDGFLNTDVHDMGTLEVYKSLPTTHTSMVAFPVSNQEMHQKDFVLSGKNVRAFLASLPLREKLDLYIKSLHEKLKKISDPKEKLWIHRSIEDAILRDIAIELETIQKQSLTPKDNLVLLLNFLNKISEVKHPAATEEMSHKMIRFFARLKVIIKSCNDKRAIISTKMINKTFDAMFVKKDENQSAHELLAKEVATLHRKFGFDRKIGFWASFYKNGDPVDPVFSAIHAFSPERLVRDSELASNASERILSGETYDQMRAKRLWIKNQQEDYKKRQ